MPRTSIVKPYRWLAQYYDELFTPLRGPINAGREQVLRRVLPHVETACDLDGANVSVTSRGTDTVWKL
jgi:hypothetical protein